MPQYADILSEEHPKNHEKFPPIKLHGEVFGGCYIYKSDMYWLESDIHTPETLNKMLDRVDKINLREFILPQNWESDYVQEIDYIVTNPHR